MRRKEEKGREGLRKIDNGFQQRKIGVEKLTT